MKKLITEIPNELHSKFKAISSSEKTTMAGLIRAFIEDYVRKKDVDFDKNAGKCFIVAQNLDTYNAYVWRNKINPNKSFYFDSPSKAKANILHNRNNGFKGSIEYVDLILGISKTYK